MSKSGMTAKPKRGPGGRNVECPEYSKCLDFAAKKDWKSFNCEACPRYKKKRATNPKPMTADKKKSTRLCDCGKPTMSPGCPYCASCMAKKSHEARAARQKAEKRSAERPASGRTREDTIHDMPKPGKPPTGPDRVLVIDFGKYPDVLTQLEKLAEQEVRPIDLQVIYALRRYLRTSKHLHEVAGTTESQNCS